MTQTLPPVAAPTRTPLRPWASAAGRLFVAYWGSLALLDLTRGLPDAVAAAALLLLTIGCSVRQSRTAALSVAAITWCFLVGFVSNSYGALTPLHPRDALALGVLGVAAVAAAHLRRRTGTVGR